MENKIIFHENQILIGLGGTGGRVLREFKKRLIEEYPDANVRGKLPVAMMYVDSTCDLVSNGGGSRSDFMAMGQDASFTQTEFLDISEPSVECILNEIDSYPYIKNIVGDVETMKLALQPLGATTGQKRRAGRLLFAANAQRYVSKLKESRNHCITISGYADTYIHIFAGLAGGTGSGAVIDAVMQACKEFPEAKIMVYAMLPEQPLPKPGMDQGRYYQNGYAALRELNALLAGAWLPHDVTEGELTPYLKQNMGKIVNGMVVYSNVNENGLMVNSFDELPKIVSDFLFARILLLSNYSDENIGMIRACTFEGIDDYLYEYDETAQPDAVDGHIPVARTKKVASFGMMHIVYPQLRMLMHAVYATAKGVFNQFKYNNWSGSQGFIAQDRGIDLEALYLNETNLSDWCLDLPHLTLEKKVLPDDTEYFSYQEYWNVIATIGADKAKKDKSPLSKLDAIMEDSFVGSFREVGVHNYFASREKMLPEFSDVILKRIERTLYDKWSSGELASVELQQLFALLMDKLMKTMDVIEEAMSEESSHLEAYLKDKQDNVYAWDNLNVLHR